MMNGPRDFFEQMVKPAFDDWQKDLLSERKMRTVTIFLDSMADWMFHHQNLEATYRERGPSKYRDQLALAQPAFGLIRDTADCTKHVRLTRKTAASNEAALQKLFQYKSFDEVVDFDSLDDVNTTSVWIVDDGQSYWFLRREIEKVMAMWENLLLTMPA
jgi:hypothetical protein